MKKIIRCKIDEGKMEREWGNKVGCKTERDRGNIDQQCGCFIDVHTI